VAAAIELGNAYTGQPPPHEIGSSMLRSAYPPGGTPLDSLIPPGAARGDLPILYRESERFPFGGYKVVRRAKSDRPAIVLAGTG
jgi:hypothetical protein